MIESEVEEVAEEPIDTIEVNETEFRLDPADITLDQPGDDRPLRLARS